MSEQNTKKDGDPNAQLTPSQTLLFLVDVRTMYVEDCAEETDENLVAMTRKAYDLNGFLFNPNAPQNFCIYSKPNPMAKPVGFVSFDKKDIRDAAMIDSEFQECLSQDLPPTRSSLELSRQLLKRILTSGTKLSSHV
jgi:hypothetical protein